MQKTVKQSKLARPLKDISNQELQSYIKEKCTYTDEFAFTNEIICNKCRQQFYHTQRTEKGIDNNNNQAADPLNEDDVSNSNPDTENQKDQPTSTELAGPSSPKKLKLSIPKTSSSHAKCLFCDKRDNLIRINKCVRTNTFVDQGILYLLALDVVKGTFAMIILSVRIVQN